MHDSTELPIHPTTGLSAVGLRRDGRPIWPIMGGSGEGEPGGPETEPTDPADPPKSTDQEPPNDPPKEPEKGEGEDWKAKSRDWEKRAKENKAVADKAAKAQQDTLDAIAQALGLKKGEDVDPAKQIETLTGDLGKAQASERAARVELAVYKAASKHGGDADALLDSRGFLQALADLDPSEKGFADKVAEVIKDAVTANPKLAAAPAAEPKPPKKSGSDGMNGNAGNGNRKPLGLAGAVKAHYNS